MFREFWGALYNAMDDRRECINLNRAKLKLGDRAWLVGYMRNP